MYFVRNNPKDCLCERHRIKIPSLGWVRIKEKGYIPTTKDGYVIKSGYVSIKADRYYVSVLVEIPDRRKASNSGEGIGIDLGLKDFAIVSNGKTYKNINKSAKLKKFEKKLIREQRSLSRKYENLKKGESTQKRNIQKQRLKIQKLHHRIDNIRTDHINKIIAEIVKTKPSHITIEDLNVSGMMKNRHLSKAVASQKFYEFKTKLLAKCKENGIELRIVDRWYPSSKTCHGCKNINKSEKLRKLGKKLIREQRSLSRKYENLKKGGFTQKRNIQKQRLKIQKLHHRIDNIRTDYINKIIAEIVKTKPSYITIEDLNVSGMMKNKHLSKAVASQKFYEFRTKLQAKCRENGIELRVVDRWFPSSKTCHCCKHIKKDLKLSDRLFKCDCGYIEDRDFNAALNLRDATTYEVA